MDTELHSLVIEYKSCLFKLSEINTKVEKVNSSEQVIANHMSKVPDSDNLLPGPENKEKLNQVFTKLKLDVDTVFNRRIEDVNIAKINVQLYIDNTLWNLFSRTELNNHNLIFHNDPNRLADRKRLMEMITTLFELDRLQTHLEQDDEKEYDPFFHQLHEWMTQIITVYLHLCTIPEKKGILQLLTTTSRIYSWAIPLIQFNDLKKIHDFMDILVIVFEGDVWVEDDYIAVLDQLAVDFTFNKLVIESSSVKVTLEDDDSHSDTIFSLCSQITDTLMKAIRQLSHMKSVTKRLSQIVMHMSILLVESTATVKNCQDQMDAYISQLVHDFYDLKTGWFFLPNIPFKALSVDALWDVTMYLLKIKPTTAPKPTSLDQVLNENLPSITRFQYELADNGAQGFFLLSCLTNIATCIPPGVDEITCTVDANKNTLSACIITVISYTLFTIAFVDKNLREIFYKDVRDNFGPICKLHTFIISLLFRWTVQHISVMERMALYLFHSLNLNHWVILNDDLKLVHKLLSQESPTTPQQTAQILLAKYVIENLNYGYMGGSVDTNISKSQPWYSRKLPFLAYETHEEIAFILLDACQKVQPLPDANPTVENKGAIELVGSVTSAVSTYLPIADQMLLLKSTYTTTPNHANEFIQWAWSVALRLKLYDCNVSSRATDIEKSITLPFLRLVLNSYNDMSSSHSALLIYISFLLSATSRHFLRFESGDGWMKLLTILKRGKAEAIIQIFSEIIPSFVYMHGDDFFNDESLVDFFKHMIELKSDPMLVKAANTLLPKKHERITGVGIIIGSHVWQAHLIDSVSNLLDDSGQGFSYVDLVMHSWLKTVFRKHDWMWHHAYVNVVDTLSRLAFTLNRHQMVYHMLLEEQKRMEANKLASATSSPRITRFIKTMIPVSEGIYPSLLIGEWSVLNLKANTFNKTPGVENNLFWFAFEALVMETVLEKEYRDEFVIQLMAGDHLLDVNAVYQKLTISQKKPIEFFSVYRWLQHILVLPVQHVLLPLYLQMFFSLYYQPLDKITLGTLFFDKKSDMISRLRDYIASVQTYYGQKMSGNTVLNAEVLQQTFYAMWLWLGNVDLLSPGFDVRSLPSHYDVNRLSLCHGNAEDAQPWLHMDKYWMDLIDTDKLEQDFLQFPWQGSGKFRMNDDDNTSKTTVEDSISLSTTFRKQRFITAESTIIPLPSVTLIEPTV
ncbi:hypothetical protein INT47_000833 [Mucor saturninus]|uniref:Epg5-like TPR domain-containing protein n=1 Tax=Mucor saturninus TaxID=64648 RepID=A0A8H7RNH6_9FUNG|nr:hypothetical protein INT47_000833 [Mucor saturninus]